MKPTRLDQLWLIYKAAQRAERERLKTEAMSLDEHIGVPDELIPPDEPDEPPIRPAFRHGAYTCCECQTIVVLNYDVRNGNVYCLACASVEASE